MWLLCSDVKKVCLLVWPRRSIKLMYFAFLMSLLLLQLLLLQLSILIWRGTVSWHMEKSTYKFVYSETTGYYENVPVLLRGTFYTYSVSANKNETCVIEWRHVVIWKLSEANIIIFCLNYYCILNRLLKIFCSFLFLPKME